MDKPDPSRTWYDWKPDGGYKKRGSVTKMQQNNRPKTIKIDSSTSGDEPMNDYDLSSAQSKYDLSVPDDQDRIAEQEANMVAWAADELHDNGSVEVSGHQITGDDVVKLAIEEHDLIDCLFNLNHEPLEPDHASGVASSFGEALRLLVLGAMNDE